MTIAYQTMIHQNQTKLNFPEKRKEVKKMSEETVKPQTGAWNEIATEELERKDSIKWEKVGDAHTVKVKCENPREYQSKDGSGAFYVFDVEENNEEKVIMTSAWSLLKGLKKQEPLQDKELLIEKEMVNGKQFFKVTDLNAVQEVVVK